MESTHLENVSKKFIKIDVFWLLVDLPYMSAHQLGKQCVVDVIHLAPYFAGA